MKEVEAVILAGGVGKRMGEITQNRQKCLLPIDGKPILIHVIENLLEAFGSVDIKIAVGFKQEQVKDCVEKYVSFHKLTIEYVPHNPGTEGWGIYKDIDPYIHGKFIGTPGDIIALPFIYERTLSLFEQSGFEASMSVSPDLKEANTHGVAKINGIQVVELTWPPPLSLDNDHLRDMTIWASDKRIFEMIRYYPFPKKSIGYVFMAAIKDSRPIAANYYDSPWIHLGYPEDLKKSFSKVDSSNV